MSTPSNNDEIEIKPISDEKYQPEDKSYVLEPNTYDIGKYLNLYNYSSQRRKLYLG